MTSRKKVSFGSSGSIVETWIIDDVRSNQFSPSTDVNKFGSIEFCDDVMPTSRDIVVVSQPMNCNHNNHVVLNDPISIFRKDMDMDMTSKQTDEKETASNNKEEVITSQPKDVAILNITSKTVNFSSPPEIISGNIKTDNKDNTSKSEKHKVRISPYKEILNNNNSSDSNKNNNNNNSSAVISTTQQYHTSKRSSISSVNSSGSQSFRPPKIIVNTPGTGTSNQEEYYDVLNPQPVGQTSSPYGYNHTDVTHVYINDDNNDENDDDDDDEDNNKYYWESDPMLPLREEVPSLHYCVDAVTGWPLKRSDSLESRDNPFLPGGDLCKEAEDLLSKATIIRDNFYLNEEEKRELEQHRQAEQEAELQEQQHQQQLQQKSRGATKHVQILDHHDGRVYSSAPDPSSPPHNGGVEERISPQSVSNTFAAPPSTSVPSADPNHKGENGKSNDHTTNNAASSPDSVKIAIPEGEGQSIGLQGDSLGPDKKRRNKCCSVM